MLAAYEPARVGVRGEAGVELRQTVWLFLLPSLESHSIWFPVSLEDGTAGKE